MQSAIGFLGFIQAVTEACVVGIDWSIEVDVDAVVPVALAVFVADAVETQRIFVR
jgi:hypothetical protein